ncbi:MAG: hypothetical protein LBI31_06315, partial [Zoogloeaceae bacterium]|nr:hypothetical protein [Zoogloeaceae bacterium]
MSASVKCQAPDEIDALIIFPSLGAPQILPVGAKKCTIIVATNNHGSELLTDPSKGVVMVNQHLRLIKLDDDKSKLTPPCDARLFKGADEQALRESFIEINRLTLEDGCMLYWSENSSPNNDSTQTLIGCLSAEARILYRNEGFNHYFAITLKTLSKISTATVDNVPKSWAWIVTTNKERGHKFIGQDGKELAKDKHPEFMMPLHQPLDRLIHNRINQLNQNSIFAGGGLINGDKLYEISAKDGEYAIPEVKNSRRVQVRHPVMTKPDKPLKLGHLTDPHISVRAATLARSPVKIIEDSEAGRLADPVGERVANTYKSFKALIDSMVGKADVLAITGDAIDFNRNLDPMHIKEEKPSIKKVWDSLNAIANVHEEDGGYWRGIDQLYFYSLLMYALREKSLPAYYITGNHEGYQWPYGISPRVDNSFARIFYGSNYTYTLNSVSEEEKKAWEKVRETETELGDDTGQTCAKQALEEASGERRDGVVDQYCEAKAAHQAAADDLEKYRKNRIEEASAYHQKKAMECIPSDHNLTIYEACLAYGPTYGQALTAANFRREQFDWLHWLYTPFTDLNVYPCCTDLTGKDAKQAITLLGWGGDERLILGIDQIVFKMSFNTRGGSEDRRPPGFLPYAPESINDKQLELIQTASKAKAQSCSDNWSVLSHFPVVNFQDSVPADTDKAGFKPSDEKESGIVKDEVNAQFNLFNWGGCEKGLKTYIDKYINFEGESASEKVNLHLSGHSHRAGVYTLNRVKDIGYRDGISIKCHIPGFPKDVKEMPDRSKGTHFIVGSTAGPMGKQALSGWDSEYKTVDECQNPDSEKKGWTANKYQKVGKREWNAFLGGWLTRPPSGLIVDTATSKLEYVKADEDPKRNDIPRLAVMLDYQELMSLSESAYLFRPIVICPDYETESMYNLGERSKSFPFTRTTFKGGLPVKLSDEIQALDCLDLGNIKVWAYIPKLAQKTIEDGNQGKPKPALASSGPVGWHVCGASIDKRQDKSISSWLGGHWLTFKDKGDLFSKALVPEQKTTIAKKSVRGEEVLCAFMEIPLKKPVRSGVPWDEVKWQGESWVFPVDIARSATGNETMRRG